MNGLKGMEDGVNSKSLLWIVLVCALAFWGSTNRVISDSFYNQPDMIAYDGFTSYSQGSLGGANGNGGTGWTNAWSSDSYASIVEPPAPLVYRNGNVEVYGGSRAMRWLGTGSFFGGAMTLRSVSRGIDNQQRDLYFSCLCAYTNGTFSGHSYAVGVLGYLDSGNTQTGAFFGRFNVDMLGAAVHSDYWNSSVSYLGSSLPVINETYLLVGKLTWSASDNAYVQTDAWINPDDRFAPSGLHGVATPSPVRKVNEGGFERLVLQALWLGPSNDTGIHLLMDEVRVGPDWESVFPYYIRGTMTFTR